MTENQEQPDIQFLQLVMSLHAASMQQMGKVMNPATNEIDRDLEMAKNSIDLLEMIQRKTQGNLTDQESKLLAHYLYELRLNYTDEAGKSVGQKETMDEPAAADEPDSEKKE